jgi:hypothetical protein
MASRTCWNCGRFSHQTLVTESISRTENVEGVGRGVYSIPFRCDSCGVLNIGFPFAGWSRTTNRSLTADLADEERITWFPKRVQGSAFPDVPEDIAGVASEAYQCHSIDALRGAVMLARTVVEAVAKDKGITKGTLASKIGEMADQQLIRPTIRSAADEIRVIGNDMAHGDLGEPVAREDAEEILELMSAVLTEVYELPARLEARKAARRAAHGD